MIQANELRIGNKVIHKESGFIYEIAKIDDEENITLYTTDEYTKEGIYIDSDTSEIKPIKLTEEILLKCGFETIGHLYKIHLLNSLSLMFNSEHNGWYFDIYHNSSKVELQYLNELQNIYFSLIGKELNIEL